MTMSVPENNNKTKPPVPVAAVPPGKKAIPDFDKFRKKALKKKIGMSAHEQHVAHDQHVQHVKNKGAYGQS